VSRPTFLALAALLSSAALLAACGERPPMQTTQLGYRGLGQVQVDNPRMLAKAKAALPEVPPTPPAASDEGPRAREVFQNLQVLGHLSVGELTRQMLAFTQWVAPPEEGCNYCHNPANLADDSKYQKIVARRMIQMTQQVNSAWAPHVQQTGVTCYTCHRGKAIPSQVWFTAAAGPRNHVGVGMGDDAGQNKAEPSIAWASLPYDPYTSFLLGDEPIRAQGLTALPQPAHRSSIKQAEFTYSLMNHISQALGVNCTFCHNTQSFMGWNDKRVRAWYGIRMARDINNAYLQPLAKTFPANRLGPTGDVAKVYCATCHQGVNKPLAGLQMAKDYPALRPAGAPPLAPVPLPAPPTPSGAVAPAVTTSALPEPAQLAQR
jgi:photosynthetic reaction center cytochrome c subunit